jgi:hypothetical protein
MIKKKSLPRYRKSVQNMLIEDQDSRKQNNVQYVLIVKKKRKIRINDAYAWSAACTCAIGPTKIERV